MSGWANFSSTVCVLQFCTHRNVRVDELSATSSWTRCNVTRDTSRFSSTNDGGGDVPSSNTLSRGAEGEKEEGSKGKPGELHDGASKAKIEEKE